MIAGLTIGVVARGNVDTRARALRERGATVRVLDAGELAQDLGPSLDALVMAVGDEPERFAAFRAGVAAQVGAVPILALVSLDLPARRVAVLGPVTLLDDGLSDDALATAVLEVATTAPLDSSARAEEAEARAAALADRLAAAYRETQTLAHDVRVLCGVALGYAANMRDGFAGELSPTQATHVAQVLAAISDIGGLLERFTGAVRAHVDVDESPPPSISCRAARRRAQTDLSALVGQVVALFANVARDKSIALGFDGGETPVRVWCDPTQVKQATTNLLVNALKFTPAGGAVNVVVGFEAASGEPSTVVRTHTRKNARVLVRDNGPGVAPEDRERIFGRGERASRHANVEGSGIGLAVVRDVATQHGGNVRVEDAPGGGASFVLTLPVDLRRRREGSVLFVDDADVAQRLVGALTSGGLSTLDAAAAAESLSALLDGCSAIVAVPRSGFAEVERSLAGAVGPISSRGGE